MSDINFTEPKPSTPPISTSEIISHAFENYKNTILYSILAVVIIFILNSIISSFIGGITGFNQVYEEFVKDMMSGKKFNYNEFPHNNMYTLLSFLSSVILMPMYAGVLYIIHKANVQQDIQFSDLFIGYQQNTLQIMLYGAISMVLIVIGLMMCILPGIIVAALLSLGLPILFFENKTAMEALQKSFQVSKPHFMTLLATGIVAFLISASGILLCFIGVILTAMFSLSATYSAYCAICGTPRQITN